ncbi:MAG: hypothetical protein IKE56_07595 [Lachnospiraceae bacterium]|nr:hypothetical protein [Lachnospiraceae bacterium]
MTKDYYNSRRRFDPVKGEVYENEGGGTFRCLGAAHWIYGAVIMQNVRSGWTFKAHGVGIYKDGRIDWDYSTDGYFAEVQA